MDAQEYRAAQLALFEQLAAGTAAATAVPLRARYVGVATCLTLVHLLPGAFAARIHAEVVAPLREAGPSHHWLPARLGHARASRRRDAVLVQCDEVCSRRSRGDPWQVHARWHRDRPGLTRFAQALSRLVKCLARGQRTMRNILPGAWRSHTWDI